MISKDARIREAAFARERYLRDQRQLHKEHRRREAKRYAEGKADGRLEGRTEGMLEGRAEGKTETLLEVIARCKEANFSNEMMMLATGLSQSEIEGIAESI